MRGPVAIVAHAAYPADPRIRRQAEALAEAGIGVDVFALRESGQPDREEGDGIRILRLPVRRLFSGLAGHFAEYLAFTGFAAVALAREHRRRHYGLVQVATVPDFLAAAGLPERMAGVPLLLDLHEDMPAFYRDRFRGRLLRPLSGLVLAITRGSARLADEMLTVHEPLRALAVARGVPPERITVVMNGADERLFDPDRVPRRAFMADGTLRLVHHSSLQRIYGLDLLVEAVARIGDRLSLRVDVYGDGPFRAAVAELIERRGIADRVHLHGRVPIEALPRLIADADVGVVPSRPEPYLQLSLSTKLLEYAAMGMPTIASDLATFRAHLGEDAVWYVRGGDPEALAAAIELAARSPERLAAMGAAARREALPYAWGVQKRIYLEVVERLLDRRIGGA